LTNSSTQHENPLVTTLKQDLGSNVIDITSPREKRIFLTSTKETYRHIIKYLQEQQECHHLILINGVDLRNSFEVVYHFWSNKRHLFTLKVTIPRDNPKINTITDITPAAILYEREVHDLFGIDFVGHPDLRRLVLADDWPEGNYPLRKDWKLEKKPPYCLLIAARIKAAKEGKKIV